MDSSADRCIRHMELGQCVTCAPACRLNKYSILQSTTSAQCGWSTEGSCCTNSVVSLLTYKKAVTLQHFRSPARLRLANRLVEKNEVSVKLWLLTSSHDNLRTSLQTSRYCAFLYHPLISRRSLGRLWLSRSTPYYKPIKQPLQLCSVPAW